MNFDDTALLECDVKSVTRLGPYTIPANDEPAACCPSCGNQHRFMAYAEEAKSPIEGMRGWKFWLVCECGYDPTLGQEEARPSAYRDAIAIGSGSLQVWMVIAVETWTTLIGELLEHSNVTMH